MWDNIVSIVLEGLWVTGVIILWSVVISMFDKLFPTTTKYPWLSILVGAMIVYPISPTFSVLILWASCAIYIYHWNSLKGKLTKLIPWVSKTTATGSLVCIMVIWFTMFRYFTAG